VASAHRAAPGFWLAVVVTGAGTGLGAVALMHLLYVVQHTLWPGAGMDLLDAAARADWTRHLAILLGAGVLTSVGRLLLGRLPGTSIDVTSAIWLHAGRLPALRSLGSAVVGMGVSLGREGAPKQAGAVIANAASDRGRLSDDARRLLVACGSGASLAAAYGVPLGGALFALEVLRGELALRFVLPALLTSLIATGVAWLFLPDAPTYAIPAYTGSLGSAVWVLLAGPVAGLVAVLYVRAVAWADRHRPKGGPGVAAPVLALGLLGDEARRQRGDHHHEEQGQDEGPCLYGQLDHEDDGRGSLDLRRTAQRRRGAGTPAAARPEAQGRVARHGAGDQARRNGSGRERRESPVVAQESEAALGIFDGQFDDGRQGGESRMRSDRDETGTDRTVTRRSVAIPVGARGELAVVEMKGDDAVEHALVGKSVGQAPSRVVAREVHARGMKVARVDEQTQPLGRRSHVAEKARQLADVLAQLASLAGVLDVQAGPRGHPLHELA